MILPETHQKLRDLAVILDGDLWLDDTHRLMYATDASAYREIPLGIALPKNISDIRRLVRFAGDNHIPLIPRTAGTSLAGQVVGNGLIADVSRYMNHILEINTEEHWVRVEPGVILDELNKTLEPMGLFFGPETSTSSRCMIGGMVGNNSCGAHSILYGSTRDHILSLKTILSDGSDAEFSSLNEEEFMLKTREDTLEGRIYREIRAILINPENREQILKEYPHVSLRRRNTGYAIDLLLRMKPFRQDGIPFNFSALLAGSEGTLAFTTEIKLNLVPLPPAQKALICVHCHSVDEALKANLIALKYNPGSIELMDKPIMDCTRGNILQRQNRFFIEGDPEAILIIEFARETRDEICKTAEDLEKEMRESGYGYHFPLVFPPDVKKVWDLRKAGLGVLSNYPGDRKPVPVTEDTAVRPEDLPAYISEFKAMLDRHGLNCVYYAHAGSGELHLRPILNLKDPGDVELFHTIAMETAQLVKKYKGSLSGEHGDGRLRGEFIPMMIGQHNYEILKRIKKTWDPECLFNPGKITDTPRMNTHLRYDPGETVRDIQTYFDFSATHGILRAAEKCNGSGDCRNTVKTGKWMCPSYMALQVENTTTRARANILREFLTHSSKTNPFDHQEIYDVMDLCLSCKACKSECPSSVDMTRLKAEFLQHYYDDHKIPLRTLAIAYITSINRLGSIFPELFNFFVKNTLFSSLVKKILGFSSSRNIPLLYKTTLRKWAKKNANNSGKSYPNGIVYLFVDEFSNYNDVETGIKTILLLNELGYEVHIPGTSESGRTFLSKGLVKKAKNIAAKNILAVKDILSEQTPLVGIEPSAILTFRDEYPDLLEGSLREEALRIAPFTFLYDEFFVREMKAGKIHPESFTSESRNILLHGHCHQKSLASVEATRKMLSFPENYVVKEIPSGCCGMAGSFGFEKEHYELSQKIGELVLFPTIRQAPESTIIAAPGTSCRHQIREGTGREALHPVEILYEALLK
ncbi:MAG: FAD-linked oxidase C-terminal domain-containing protein [Bacteroidota bacterium]|nr:FAD-linked oxidase C-terminal domain-containing protein [Bacteroidota bacterium]